ncbi:MAG: hypothetical protein Q9M92_05750 [Enterobacterales bacterium]|nr:hypothetical protein [Enterobacterales bacterium]
MNNGEFYYFNVSSNYDNNLSEKIEKSKNRAKALFGLKCHVRFIRPSYRVDNKKKLDPNLNGILLLQNDMPTLFDDINKMLKSTSLGSKKIIEWEKKNSFNKKYFVEDVREIPSKLLVNKPMKSFSSIARDLGYPNEELEQRLIEDKVIHRVGTNLKLSINSSLVDAEVRNADRGGEYIVYNSERLKNRYKIEGFVAFPSRKFKTIKNEADKKLSKFNGAYLNMVQQELERGTAILTSEEQLNWYVKSYAVKHQQRIKAIFKMLGTKINLKQVFGNPFSIVDYACGQGLSALFSFESLSGLIGKQQCKSLALIEPSINALNKAKYNFRGNVIAVNKKFSELISRDIQTAQENWTLHLFMNVLDMNCIKNDIQQLSQLIVKSINGNNIFICVSPYNFSQIKTFYSCMCRNVFHKNGIKLLCEVETSQDGIKMAALVFEVNEYGPI